MKIGLIDVDGHNFPNLALMRISAYHKSIGDDVSWWSADSDIYDVVYMSKVFSNTYTSPVSRPLNCKKLVKGGTGFAISNIDGVEVYDKSKDSVLLPDMEKMFPDYSIYPEFDFAVSMTSRGCPRGCAFCHVASKEGKCAAKVADVSDFWCGQREIKVLDPNITALKPIDKRDLMTQYINTGAIIDFTQGLDIRLLTEDDISDINAMRISEIHFAWDNPNDALTDKFKYYADRAKHRPHGHLGTVYCLTNFNSSMEQNLYRIYTLRDMGFNPYVMIYDKPNASKEIKRLQRWCNNKWIFRSCERFEDYKP